jgi:alpha-galactosidase
VAAIHERVNGVEFAIDFEFDISVEKWNGEGDRYQADPYELVLTRDTPSEGVSVLEWEIRRTDGEPVVLKKQSITYHMPLVSLYRVWPTSGIAANSVYIDLPWSLDTLSSAAGYDPVLMALNSDGTNTYTVGLLDTATETRITGKMGRRSPEAEAGFTSHVYHAGFERPCGPDTVKRGEVVRDGLFVSTVREDWFDSLGRYTALIDSRRDFKGREVSERALLPMWHSWYAFENEIDQDNVISQIDKAKELGFGTFQLDAGWNTGKDWVIEEGCYEPERSRFPDFERVMEQIKDAGLVPIAHWSPPWLGPQARNRELFADAIQQTGEWKYDRVDHLCPRTPATMEHIVDSARHMVADLGFGGLWFDFVDSMPVDRACESDHEHTFASVGEAWDAILQAAADAVWEIDPDCVLIYRRSHANINNKPYLTHLWPADAPFDFDKNRREVVVTRAYGAGVLTHACCTCWAPDETDLMVAKHLASVVLAGVPAISIDLTRFPESHLEGIRSWLSFYQQHRRELMLGEMRPLVFMPPSAVVRTEAEDIAFVGYFEGLPGITSLSKDFDELFLVNCYADDLHTLLPSQRGRYEMTLYDHFLRPLEERQDVVEATSDGLDLRLRTGAPAVVHLKRLA